MIHEQDFLAERGACDFEHILFSTPRDLVKDGLYKPLAIPMYSSQFGEVSLGTVMQVMGLRKRHKKRRISVKTMMKSLSEVSSESIKRVSSRIQELTPPAQRQFSMKLKSGPKRATTIRKLSCLASKSSGTTVTQSTITRDGEAA